MKAAETKTTTAAQPLQAKGEAQQPFFQKEGDNGVLSNQTEPFFSPSGSASNDTQPFFTKSTARPKIQTKLTIGQPGDKYEQEADSMADQVVQKLADNSTQLAVDSQHFTESAQPQISKFPNFPISQFPVSNIQRKPIFESEAEPNVQTKRIPNFQTSKPQTPNIVQRKCAECEQEEKLQQKEELSGEEEPLQMKPIFESNAEPPEDNSIQRKCSVCGKEETIQRKENSESSTTSNLESQLNTSKGSGAHLPDATRTSMEGAFGADFSNVRVHTNSTAVQMNKDLGAQAFTHGSDVYFNAGKYNPGSGDGQKLLAHELTHTVQQGGANNLGRHIQKQEATSSSFSENCEPWRQQMVLGHITHALAWVNQVISILSSFPYSRRSRGRSRVSSIDRYILVAYNLNFERTGRDLTIIIQRIRSEILPNLQAIASGLTQPYNYGCFPCFDRTLALTRSSDPIVTDEGVTLTLPPPRHINLCRSWFSCTSYEKRVTTLIHEMAHNVLMISEDIYEWDPAYLDLTYSVSRNNAESYAVFVRQVFYQGGMIPGSVECPSG